MTIEEYSPTFAGYPVLEYDPGLGAPGGEAARGIVYRLTLSYEASEEGQEFGALLDRFLSELAAAETPGLVIGMWGFDPGGSSRPIVEALVAARDRLPRLRGIFLGDILREECEISWINQSDVSPLLAAYPHLEHLRVRGSNNLSLGHLQHRRLRSLIVESGGLPAGILEQVAEADLPELEHLELWLGAANYGFEGIETLGPILAGEKFPKLRYLGLRDCEVADTLAQTLAKAPILERIGVLDLSLGNLGDEGARGGIRGCSRRALRGARRPGRRHVCSMRPIS